MSETMSVMRLRHTKRPSGILRSLFTGFLTASAFLFLVVLLFSGIFFGSEDPAKLLLPASMGILLFAAFLFGFVAAKSFGKQGALMGALSGAVLFTVLFLLALILGYLKENVGMLSLFYLAVALVSFLGGILGGRKPTARKKLSF